LLSGSTVEVKETMARFTTDVIASCAFGINGNSLKDPHSEFGRIIRKVFDFSVQKGLATLLAFFAPYLNRIFRLKFLDDKTNNYVRQIVWNTVEYR
jgi:cytochrome P450 family 6